MIIEALAVVPDVDVTHQASGDYTIDKICVVVVGKAERLDSPTL
jgi:hypothetical protein